MCHINWRVRPTFSESVFDCLEKGFTFAESLAHVACDDDVDEDDEEEKKEDQLW